MEVRLQDIDAGTYSGVTEDIGIAFIHDKDADDSVSVESEIQSLQPNIAKKYHLKLSRLA